MFYITLFLSSLLHLIVLSAFSSSGTVKLAKPRKSLEVTYQSVKAQPFGMSRKKIELRDIKAAKKPAQLPKMIKLFAKNSEVLPAFLDRKIRDISRLTEKFKMGDKQSPKINPLDRNRKILLPKMRAEKISDPQYLTYDQNMRHNISQNIRKRAYAYVTDPNFSEGDVFLTFVLQSSGLLSKIKINEDKTAANSFLRQIALRSVRESSPFSPFPRGFNYPEFTFNLLISFRE